jgi:hypothetical protein
LSYNHKLLFGITFYITLSRSRASGFDGTGSELVSSDVAARS